MFNFLSIILNGGDYYHMMDWGNHMMDWFGIPFFGFWWFGVWIIQLILAILVYLDAGKKDKNGLLWFILVIIPWVGLLFLIGYIIIRDEEVEVKAAIKDAQHILDERYAKGEITRTEYLQMKKDIKKE